MQVELAAKLASSDQGALADDFMRFMLGDAFQSIIPTTNWMYPAKTPSTGLPAGFETLITPAKSLLLSPQQAGALRDAAISEWRNALLHLLYLLFQTNFRLKFFQFLLQ